MRVAIVHDYLTQFGGAERVLVALMKLFPHAPVFTLVHDLANIPINVDKGRLKTSFLQRIPGAKARHRYFPLLMPLAIEQFDFSEYDIVLSATHSFGKGVITGAQTMHISYCFTPTRYLWDDSHRYVREFSRSPWFRSLAPAALSYVRLWDYYASRRVDSYLTLSNFVATRIKKYYKREAEVIYPPVDVSNFAIPAIGEDYYLIVSRLVPYKRIDLAIAACEKLGKRLLIAGVGPEQDILEAKGKSHTEFLGFVSEEKLPQLYAGAKALLFPQEEDFGITPLEAAAAGKPTIAFASGGATETIINGETGLLFAEQSVDALAQAILNFEMQTFSSDVIKQQALKFSEERFLQQMGQLVQDKWLAYQQTHATRV